MPTKMFSAALAAAGLAACAMSAAAPAQAASTVVDPQCLWSVPWVVDPTSGPIQISGCRPVSQIPAADAQGWIEYDDASGGFLRSRVTSTAADGTVTFDVQMNGGGSGTFPYTVSGKPGPGGVLVPATVKVDALPAT